LLIQYQAMKERSSGSRGGVFAAEFGSAGVLLLLMLSLPGCLQAEMEAQTKNEHLTTNQFVRDVVNHPAFKRFSELLLPWEDNSGNYDTRLNQVGSLMPYHGHVNAGVVVGALNHLIDEARVGRSIYTERQRSESKGRK
jgi:hypothetical protein